MALGTFKTPPNSVKIFSLGVYYAGVNLQYYFVFMVMRDLVFIIYWFYDGDFLGFWKNLIWHVISILVDSFILIILAVWCAIVLHTPGAEKCYADPACRQFLNPMRSNVFLALSYVFFAICLKWLLFIFFFFAMGGVQMLIEDI